MTIPVSLLSGIKDREVQRALQWIAQNAITREEAEAMITKTQGTGLQSQQINPQPFNPAQPGDFGGDV